MSKLSTFTLGSPFDYTQNSLLYIASDLPFPNANNEGYIEALSIKIEELITISNGHAVVLFTSYQVLGKVFDYIKEKDFTFPVKNVSRNNNHSIKNFRESKNSVLFATGPFWEGVDFKGDLLSHLIIVKLPFLAPDPITEHLAESYKTFEEFRKEILIPRMLIKLKQGHGRAIRSETDTAVISILDIRANGLYKNQVINALPKCNVTNKTEDIKKFIQEKKSPEYFL
jgi:ATP-dependent DNA helicase DinG